MNAILMLCATSTILLATVPLTNLPVRLSVMFAINLKHIHTHTHTHITARRHQALSLFRCCAMLEEGTSMVNPKVELVVTHARGTHLQLL